MRDAGRRTGDRGSRCHVARRTVGLSTRVALASVQGATVPAGAAAHPLTTHDSTPPVAPRYRGRFAPSPTGPLHRGSLVTALASWLDARAHDGIWIVRMEDLDEPRCVPGAADDILDTLSRLGLHSDEPIVWQSRRHALYEHALADLAARGLVYPCGCTRREIADSLTRVHARHSTLAYPGTCRDGLHGKTARAWRLRVPDADAARMHFNDRWMGPQTQDLAAEVGDFVLKRADGQWAYQLAVVVDDQLQDITDIVRGADLLDSTARQIYLQACLGAPTPRYLHVPLVMADDGEKLSKQNGAAPLTLDTPAAILAALKAAAAHLGLPAALNAITHHDDFYAAAIQAWRERFGG
ncbi:MULTISPECIES: tRNA glutamyl-Q(34) synthetase GluQRS [Pandoraea]|uniref:tRNA glutamyl-Q(34) synthetase GluQRS n=1 Tax=Pandoraea TaxID=93217 RepID=UPI001F5C68E8|nr:MULTISPECIES: tRNA glutamyl-Q(34) synthetase GluQRS [Pandoraea]MCI3205326.1 tRNA glutamyl-Q(34) synthetase GluQRS [Pandoraea sp. LA3]MDN4583354.1 tRNA glutamyl-Q(34) synthetase GluQRS [Pandoraea capi]